MRTRRRSPHPAPQEVRVVTDSTACLPAGLSGGPVVVPLRVLVGDEVYAEGEDITPERLAELVAGGAQMSTSQPPPEAFAAVYRGLGEEGARSIVSVHLSGALSGTVGSAGTAAARSPLQVRAVDSRTGAAGLGFAARAIEVAGTAHAVFVVDTLEHLHRGGRLSGPAAALGTVLGVKPILRLSDGAVELAQRVRTRAVGAERLLEQAAGFVAEAVRPVVAVHHFGAHDRAQALAGRLHTRTRVDVEVTPLSAVLGVHVGPGTLAVVVADLGTHSH